nr:MAG TPA: hypothetical protein [Caudoviricetes sp.]
MLVFYLFYTLTPYPLSLTAYLQHYSNQHTGNIEPTPRKPLLHNASRPLLPLISYLPTVLSQHLQTHYFCRIIRFTHNIIVSWFYN